MRPLLCVLALFVLACDSGDTGDADFELDAPAATISITQGQTGSIDVTIVRFGGFDERVIVTASGLRAGITPGVLSLPAGDVAGTLELAVETSAVPGLIDGAMLVGMAGELERSAPVSIEILAR